MKFFSEGDPDIGPPPQFIPTPPIPQTNPVKPALPEIVPDSTKAIPNPVLPEINPSIQPEIKP